MKVVNVRDYGGIEGAKHQGVVYAGRPSTLGNPCSAPGIACPVCNQVHFGKGMVQLTDCRSIECYRKWLWHMIRSKHADMLAAMSRLNENSVLGCWCKPKPCHLDVLAKAWVWCRDNGYFKGAE